MSFKIYDPRGLIAAVQRGIERSYSVPAVVRSVTLNQVVPWDGTVMIDLITRDEYYPVTIEDPETHQDFISFFVPNGESYGPFRGPLRVSRVVGRVYSPPGDYDDPYLSYFDDPFSVAPVYMSLEEVSSIPLVSLGWSRMRNVADLRVILVAIRVSFEDPGLDLPPSWYAFVPLIREGLTEREPLHIVSDLGPPALLHTYGVDEISVGFSYIPRISPGSIGVDFFYTPPDHLGLRGSIGEERSYASRTTALVRARLTPYSYGLLESRRVLFLVGETLRAGAGEIFVDFTEADVSGIASGLKGIVRAPDFVGGKMIPRGLDVVQGDLAYVDERSLIQPVESVEVIYDHKRRNTRLLLSGPYKGVLWDVFVRVNRDLVGYQIGRSTYIDPNNRLMIRWIVGVDGIVRVEDLEILFR